MIDLCHREAGLLRDALAAGQITGSGRPGHSAQRPSTIHEALKSREISGRYALDEDQIASGGCFNNLMKHFR